MKPVLYIIIPCYNEQDVLPITSKLFENELLELINLEKISNDSRILFVNDGSTDKTWDIICNLAQSSIYFMGISQSRNRGHQSSLLAGLMEAKDQCDITISIDCDGQDDVHVMDKMINAYLQGSEIVYSARAQRETDTFFKRFTAESFYHIMNWMGAEVIFNHADYRLISSRVLQEFSNYKEVNLFLRGMIPLVGFNSAVVYYTRHERVAGKSHYPLGKMLALAIDGITSLSIKPLRIITGFGLMVAVLSFVGVIWSIASHFFQNTIIGWTSMTCIICFISGVQLISIGVLGEYIGKTYMETKRRPRFIISERTANCVISKQKDIITGKKMDSNL